MTGRDFYSIACLTTSELRGYFFLFVKVPHLTARSYDIG
jgi:hypothetical protein